MDNTLHLSKSSPRLKDKDVCVCVCVFRNSSVFMIQLLHKNHIWFSVSLLEQQRGRTRASKRVL